MIDALVGAPGSTAKLLSYFHDKTRELMLSQSWTTVGGTSKNVDIVRDVLRYVPIHWASEVVCRLCFGSSKSIANACVYRPASS